MGKAEQQEIRKLRARVLELEKMVATQIKLIEILKSMPGCREVRLKDETKTVRKTAQRKGGVLVKDGTSGQSEDSGREAGDNNQNS
jgi:hypothetical protein